MQWPEPRLTWPDAKLVCCTFRVAYEAFRESGRFKQSSKIKVNVERQGGYKEPIAITAGMDATVRVWTLEPHVILAAKIDTRVAVNSIAIGVEGTLIVGSSQGLFTIHMKTTPSLARGY
jgi:hypothetical protein